MACLMRNKKTATSRIDNAQLDKDNRSLIEAEVEARRELLAIESALVEFGQLLSKTEQEQLTNAMQNVQQAIEIHDKTTLDKAVADLKVYSDEFASVIMNQAVSQTMTGTTTEQWQS